ncbi:MAG: SDR family NAD(P)-dependent oxidoreductase, partial [Verrucomicrobiaceae bacterium]
MNPPVFKYTIDSSEFAGKRVLVTGGSKGAGQAIVRRLAQGGASVAAVARALPEEGSSPAALFVEADLLTAEGAAKTAETVLREFGGVDIII